MFFFSLFFSRFSDTAISYDFGVVNEAVVTVWLTQILLPAFDDVGQILWSVDID